MLDEEQGGGDGRGIGNRDSGLMRALGDDDAVEEGLEVVVAVVGDIGGIEDGGDIGEVLQSAGACLVIDDADTVLACLGVGDAVETVDDTTDL